MEGKMHVTYKIAIAVLVGAGLGAVAIEGLHAQAQTKRKAYQIAEIQMIGTPSPDYLPHTRAAIDASHGKSLYTLNGRVIPIDGAAPPTNVALVECESVEDALAFYKSKAWTDGDADRAKSERVLRPYLVEAEK
jgi:uncharacterized protein (DUF1330 family)